MMQQKEDEKVLLNILYTIKDVNTKKAMLQKFVLNSFHNFVKMIEVLDNQGSRIVKDIYLYNQILEYFDNPEKHLLLCLPRKFAKTLLSSLFCCYYMLKYPNNSILLVSDTRQKSRTMLKGIKNLLKKKEIYEIFGDIFANTGNTEHSILLKSRSTTRKEPNLLSISIEVSPQGYRADLILCDDIISALYSKSPAVKMATDYNFACLKPLLEKTGRFVYVGTRYAVDDIIAQVITQNTIKDEWQIVIESVYDESGNIKHPEIMDENELESIKNSTTPSIFASQYLNSPIISGESMFDLDKYKRFNNYDEILNKDTVIFFGVDLSTGRDASKGDDSAIAVIGKTSNNYFYLLDAYFGKETIEDFYISIRNLNEKWHPKTIFIEAIGGFAIAYQYIQTRTREDNVYMPIYEVSAQTENKNDRIENTLEPLLRNGFLILPEHLLTLKNKHLNKLINFELISFNKYSKNNIDDGVDALELAIRMAKNTIINIKIKKDYFYI